MLISHEHKFIFIHIGKTGGTSIEKVLCNFLGIRFETTKRDENGEWWKHIWAKGMREKVGPEVWNNYFTFAFVRNPYDMILSLYSMYTQYPEYTNFSQHPDLFHPWNQYKNFDEMVIGMARRRHEPDEKWRQQLDKLNARTQTDIWTGLENLQTSYLTESWKGWDGEGEILVDFVGRYESLDKDFQEVCRIAGLPKLDLIHQGATRHRHYTDCYSEDAKNVVYDHFALDIDRFGYTF
jgi:hypothetical protein